MNMNDSVYLSHILNSIEYIEEYIQGMERSDFLSSNLVQDGTIRQIEIIGEAVKCLSGDLRNKYPQVPWSDIEGMQDKLIYDYFNVDSKAVWYFAKFDVPVLKDEVLAILGDLETEK